MAEQIYSAVERIYGLNGDSWSTPASTLEAFWSALGAGANGLVLNVFLSKDGMLVCAPEANLASSCGVDADIADLTLAEIQCLDAGKTFRSTQLDAAGQPTGVRGEDTPWQGLKQEFPLKNRAPVMLPSMEKVLQIFGRRTSLSIILPGEDYASHEALMQAVLALLDRYGLQGRVALVGTPLQIASTRELSATADLVMDLTSSCLSLDNIRQMVTLDCDKLYVSLQQLKKIPPQQLMEIISTTNEAGIGWRFVLPDTPWAPTPDAIAELAKLPCMHEGLVTQGVLPTVNALAPRSVIFADDFAGDKLDLSNWSAGYSHINRETTIEVKDGLIIRLNEGSVYSGGAAIALLPLHGDFDATVMFEVESPAQATTFEMAAIAIDPGYCHINNADLTTRAVNLTFDVHGAPPYASSERDQNDGFRCGWNNSFNLTKFGEHDSTAKDADWIASSGNMYNKYGRDVGDGSTVSLTGQLRLVRSGAVFNSYYRDKHNAEWVCSGSMLVQNMPQDVYIRLAAKHWGKVQPTPANCVRFNQFNVRQH